MRLVEVEYFAKKYKIAVCAMSDRLHHQKINTCVTVTEEKVLYESLLLFQNGGWGLLHFPPVPLRWKEGEEGALGRDYRCN